MPETIYGQRDFGGTRLGTCDGIDRGLYGCKLTTYAMILTHYADEHPDWAINPADLDELLTRLELRGQPGGYVDGCDGYNGQLHDLHPEIVYEGFRDYSGGPADLAQLSMDLEQEKILQLDGNFIGLGYPTHYVRAWDWDGTTLKIANPWTKALESYDAAWAARAITGIETYRLPGFRPAWAPEPAPPPPDPTPAPAPAVRAALLLNDHDLVQHGIAAGFAGAGLVDAICVALAESAGDAHASNTAGNTPPSTDRGLFQINDHWHPEVTDDCAYDPICAFREAYRISKAGTDWSSWSSWPARAQQFKDRAAAAVAALSPAPPPPVPAPTPEPAPVPVPKPAPVEPGGDPAVPGWVAEAGVSTSEWKALRLYALQLVIAGTAAVAAKIGLHIPDEILRTLAELEIAGALSVGSYAVSRGIRKRGLPG